MFEQQSPSTVQGSRLTPHSMSQWGSLVQSPLGSSQSSPPEDSEAWPSPSASTVATDTIALHAREGKLVLPKGEVFLPERWGGELPLAGRVRRIEPTGFTKVSALGVEEQRVWVIAELSTPREQWQQLGDGYRVEAEFILWQEDAVLQVPASALFRSADGWAVFAMENGRAALREVRVGRSNGLQTQLLDGLAEGAAVIVHPDETIEDGTRVVTASSDRTARTWIVDPEELLAVAAERLDTAPHRLAVDGGVVTVDGTATDLGWN